MVKTLGIFDSGLGGYSVYHDLKNYGPKISYVLYADQKNAPFGNKDKDTIYEYAKNAMLWFKEKNISNVLLACNTVSAVALEKLKKEFPSMQIWGIIDLTLSQISDVNSSISVVATQATVRSHAYKEAWNQPESVFEYPLVDLVEMIENGDSMKTIDAYIKSEKPKIKDNDYLILACTHFPLVKKIFKDNFSYEIIDSRRPIQKFLSEIAVENNNDSFVYTSGNPKTLHKQIKKLYNINEEVRRI